MPGMKTILVVDDEPSLLFALSEGLSDRRRGLRVATAANGIEAVAVLEAEPVDLVLTDLRMPDMDGFELLAFLRRNHAALPVILMTALGNSETSARLATAGSFELLPKPFDLPDLKRKIAEMLAQSVKGRVENISLASFLQLLEMERKTCTLSIRSHDPDAVREGKLYFRAGRLIGAITGATGAAAGRDAALEIVTWEHADIEIADGCPPVEPEIEAPLSFLLMEGMRLKDEREQGRPPETPDPTGEPDLDEILTDASPRSEELSRRLAERLQREKGTKGIAAILLVETGGTVIAAAGEGEKRGAEIAAAAARFLRDRGLGEALQEVLVTTADHYWLLRTVGAGRRFLLLILDRHRGNLARAQLDLVEIERGL
jgi:CheY-like chemotaxis protein